ncbi:MAG: lysylphosphatidylglycerol synthase transmembrane domain-containing protein [Chthoniobacterales bacterium]
MKKTLLTILQVIVTLSLLWWIFHDPKQRANMAEALHQANFLWLAAGVLIFGMVIFTGTYRWWILLRVQQISLPIFQVGQLFLIGLFFNLFLPGGTGGDIVKIFYLFKVVPKRKSSAFLSVVVDRVFGVLALVFFAVVVGILHFDLLMKTRETAGLFSMLIIVMGAFMGVLFVAFVVSKLQLVHRLPVRLPMRGTIVELSTAIDAYSRKPKAAFFVFLLSLVNHTIIFSSIYCAARAFAAQLSLGNIFTVSPIIQTLAALPISVAGIGVREKISEQLLSTLYQIPGSVAVLISITSFFMMAFWALVGGIVYLFYRSPGGNHAAFSQIHTEVDLVEKKIEDA